MHCSLNRTTKGQFLSIKKLLTSLIILRSHSLRNKVKVTLIIESNVLIHKCLGFVIDRTFHDHDCTEVEEFVDKKVRRRAQTERGNTCGGAKKKCEISPNLLSINLNFSVVNNGYRNWENKY